MKKAVTRIVLSALALGVAPSLVRGDTAAESRRFSVQGKGYTVEVQAVPTGSDIILTGRQRMNLSRDFPGENLFPEVTAGANRFFVSWIHYRKADVRLCLYDARTRTVSITPGRGFTFVSAPTVVPRETGLPLLLFRANRTDNEDVYLYEPGRGELHRITRTPASEKTITVTRDGRDLTLETETLDRRFRYGVEIDPLIIRLLTEEPRERLPFKPAWTLDPVTINTIIAFGDSITVGEMRMVDLVGELHPELAYLTKVQEALEEDYGHTYTINLGDSGTNSYHGVARMDEAFSRSPGYHCLILYGTNDVGKNTFSADSSAENLEWICLNARDTYGLHPVISTIPPVKLWDPGVQYFKENTEALNSRIIALARRNQIPYIDTYAAFFAHPDGWEACLEDIKGNHPSPLGHQIMADLFVPKILAVTPQPTGLIGVVERGPLRVVLQWPENVEFDFDHFRIEFGYASTVLDHTTRSDSHHFSFLKVPGMEGLRPVIYFRIQTVDMEGYASGFSPIQRIEFAQ